MLAHTMYALPFTPVIPPLQNKVDFLASYILAVLNSNITMTCSSNSHCNSIRICGKANKH